MSINVTVTGSPVSIKRGKMVTADMDSYKKTEVHRRRKARLEQVRQQSKDIANDLRQRVQEETNRQLLNLENKQGAELKQWQAKKLLSLQHQYQDCIEHIGAAHTKAALHAKEINEFKEQSKKGVKKAKHRGMVAAKALHERQQSQNEMQSHTKQRKNIVKDIEKIRSSCVSNTDSLVYGKSKKNNKSRLDVSLDDEMKEQRVPEEEVESFEEFISMAANQVPSINSHAKISPMQINSDLELSDDVKDNRKRYDPSLYQDKASYDQYQPVHRDNFQKSAIILPSDNRNQKSDNSMPFIKPVDYPYDSRISDHIRQRILSHNDPKYPYTSSLILPQQIEKLHKKGVDASVQSDFVSFNDTQFRAAHVNENQLFDLNNQSILQHDVSPSRHQKAEKTVEQSEIFEKEQNNVPTSSKHLVASANKLAESSKKLADVSTKLSTKLKDTSKKITESFRHTVMPQPHSQNMRKGAEFFKSMNDSSRLERSKDNSQFVRKPNEPMKSRLNQSRSNPVVSYENQGRSNSVVSYENQGRSNSVVSYDHNNRFQHSYAPQEDLVERTYREDQQVPEESDLELHAREVAERESIAKKRGREALLREKSEREYKALLNNLSTIQKVERLNSDHRQQSKAHMSDERFKEKLEQEQKQIEEAIEAIYPEIRSRPLITLDQIQRDEYRSSDVAFETVDVNKSNVPQINIAQWNAPQPSQHEEVDKEASLQILLDRINTQKKLLSSEMEVIPNDSDLQRLLQSLDHITQNEEPPTNISKKRRTTSAEKNLSSSFDTPESSTTIMNTSLNKSEKPTTKSKTKLRSSKSSTKTLQNLSEKTLEPTKSSKKSKQIVNKSSQNISQKPGEVGSGKLKTKSKSQIEISESQGDIHIVIKLNENNNKKSSFDVNIENQNKDQKISEKRQSDVLTQKTPPQMEASSILASRLFPDSLWKNVLVEQSPSAFNQNSPRENLSSQSNKFNPSANSTNASSSTAYFEPPTSFSIRSSSQKLNSTTSTEEQNLDENVKDLIDHLLGMSRNTLENLAISSPSSVPTPEPQVVITKQNFPQSFERMSSPLQIIPSRSEILSEPSLPNSSVNDNQTSSSLQESVNNDLLADFYTSRIAVLNDLIEKVRSQTDSLLDKIKDPDSTEYLSLPSPQVENSLLHEEPNRNYLNNLLKQHSVQSNVPLNLSQSQQFQRNQSLHQETNVDSDQMSFVPISPAEKSHSNFIPLLAGIPKVPSMSSEEQRSSSTDSKPFDRGVSNVHVVTPESSSSNGSDLDKVRRKSKPPPAIIQNIIRHNLADLNAVPFHELSTIIEADSSRNMGDKSDVRPIEHQSQIQMQKRGEAGKAEAKKCASCVLCKVGTQLIKMATCGKPHLSSKTTQIDTSLENFSSSKNFKSNSNVAPSSSIRLNQIRNSQSQNPSIEILSDVKIKPGSNIYAEQNKQTSSYVYHKGKDVNDSPYSLNSNLAGQNAAQMRSSRIQTSLSVLPNSSSQPYSSEHFNDNQNNIKASSVIRPVVSKANPSRNFIDNQIYHHESPMNISSSHVHYSNPLESKITPSNTSFEEIQITTAKSIIHPSTHLESQMSTSDNSNQSTMHVNVSAVKKSVKNLNPSISQQGTADKGIPITIASEQHIERSIDTSLEADQLSSISTSLEDVMKQLGLNWAIPTMKKTQQSLQMSGSSNSPEINREMPFSENNSQIDVNLKSVLLKEHSRRISGSSGSNSSNGSGIIDEQASKNKLYTSGMTSYPSIPNLGNQTNESEDQTISLMEQQQPERFSGEIPQQKFTSKNLSGEYDQSKGNVMPSSSQKNTFPMDNSGSSADSTISLMELHTTQKRQPSKFGYQIPTKGFGSVETQMDYSHSTDSTISQMNTTESSTTPSIGQVKTKPFSPRHYSSSGSSTILPDVQKPPSYIRGRTSTPIYEQHPSENVSGGSSLFHSDISEVRIPSIDINRPLTAPQSSLDVEQTLGKVRKLH